MSVLKLSESKARSRVAAGTLLRETALFREFSIEFRAMLTALPSTSITRVSKPARAHTSAMPDPIIPPPITATLLIGSAGDSNSCGGSAPASVLIVPSNRRNSTAPTCVFNIVRK